MLQQGLLSDIDLWSISYAWVNKDVVRKNEEYSYNIVFILTSSVSIHVNYLIKLSTMQYLFIFSIEIYF